MRTVSGNKILCNRVDNRSPTTFKKWGKVNPITQDFISRHSPCYQYIWQAWIKICLDFNEKVFYSRCRLEYLEWYFKIRAAQHNLYKQVLEYTFLLVTSEVSVWQSTLFIHIYFDCWKVTLLEWHPWEIASNYRTAPK